MVPTYPLVSEDFVGTWHAAFDRHGFEAELVGANLDMGRRRDRDMTPDEEFEFSELLFRGAKKPGSRSSGSRARSRPCCVVSCRSPRSSTAAGLRDPRSDGSERPGDPQIRDVYAELDSPLLGSVADFSATIVPCRRRSAARDSARPVSTTTPSTGCRRSGSRTAPMPARQEEFIGYLTSGTSIRAALHPWPLAFNMPGHVDPREGVDRLQIKHVHAKFYDIDEHAPRAAIDYPELVRVFVDGGTAATGPASGRDRLRRTGGVDPLVLVPAARPDPQPDASIGTGLTVQPAPNVNDERNVRDEVRRAMGDRRDGRHRPEDRRRPATVRERRPRRRLLRDQAKAESFAAEHEIPRAFGVFTELSRVRRTSTLSTSGSSAGRHSRDIVPRPSPPESICHLREAAHDGGGEAEGCSDSHRRTGPFSMEAMSMKSTPAMTKLTELLSSGVIGEPRLIQAGAGFPVPPDGPARNWVAELGGGALYDLGVYTLRAHPQRPRCPGQRRRRGSTSARTAST